MTYIREYKGLTIQIEGAWSEANQSNLYRWRVVHTHRVLNLEGDHPFRDWHECYYTACAAIDSLMLITVTGVRNKRDAAGLFNRME